MATIEQPRTFATNGSVTLPTAPTAGVEVEPQGLGWIVFSAIMLGFAGVWGIIEGILAISSSKIFVGDATFVFSDLNTWGWIVLGLGVLCLLAAFSLGTGSELARWFGISVAALSAVGQLLTVHANPWWAMAIFTIDMLIIYGLAAYAGVRLRLQ